MLFSQWTEIQQPKKYIRYFMANEKNKNLLIAVGDSFTQGVGCYLPEFLDEKGDPTIDKLELVFKSKERFQEFSWPRVLGNLLGWDVINLGIGGAANSACAKFLIRPEHEKYKEIYEHVVVIFMLTSPERVSFYLNNNGDIDSVIPSFIDLRQSFRNIRAKELKDWIIKYMTDNDLLNETIFHLRSVEHFSKSCGYNFYWTTAFNNIEILLKAYKEEGCIHTEKTTHPNGVEDYVWQSILRQLDGESILSHEKAFDNHLNELGYAKIGKKILKRLQLLNPELFKPC
jgi:hypothetical protein